jgi:hypothetical protein
MLSQTVTRYTCLLASLAEVCSYGNTSPHACILAKRSSERRAALGTGAQQYWFIAYLATALYAFVLAHARQCSRSMQAALVTASHFARMDERVSMQDRGRSGRERRSGERRRASTQSWLLTVDALTYSIYSGQEAAQLSIPARVQRVASSSVSEEDGPP